MKLTKVSNLSEALNETKTTMTAYNDLFAEVRKLDSRFNNISDNSINQILGCYSKDLGVEKSKVSAEDLLDFVNQSDSLGSFVLDFSDMLSCLSVIDIGKQDPRFVNTVFNYAKKIHIIDDDNKDIDTGDDISYDELAHTLIIDMNSTKGKFDTKLYNVLIQELSDEYRRTVESINEAIIEAKNDNIEPIDDTSEDTKPEEKQPEENGLDDLPEIQDTEAPVLQDITPAEEMIMNTPNAENNLDLLTPIQNLISSQWNTISEVNNLISSINEIYKGSNKDQITNILNQMLDDFTINVGMLNRVIELTNPLINSGVEKAEEIIK